MDQNVLIILCVYLTQADHCFSLFFVKKDVSPREIEYYIQELIWDYDE